jgi:predicted DNA-binding protein with PD1-like motif
MEQTIESVTGYLHSTSFAASHLFGPRLAEFDEAVRARLEELSEGGTLVDDSEFHIHIATRAR